MPGFCLLSCIYSSRGIVSDRGSGPSRKREVAWETKPTTAQRTVEQGSRFVASPFFLSTFPAFRHIQNSYSTLSCGERDNQAISLQLEIFLSYKTRLGLESVGIQPLEAPTKNLVVGVVTKPNQCSKRLFTKAFRAGNPKSIQINLCFTAWTYRVDMWVPMVVVMDHNLDVS